MLRANQRSIASCDERHSVCVPSCHNHTSTSSCEGQQLCIMDTMGLSLSAGRSNYHRHTKRALDIQQQLQQSRGYKWGLGCGERGGLGA
jgi:hypothetical protein